VDSWDDMRAFNEISRKIGIRQGQARCVVYPHDRQPYRNIPLVKGPHGEKLVLVKDVLECTTAANEGPVMNVLVDHGKIETLALCRTEEEAKRVALVSELKTFVNSGGRVWNFKQHRYLHRNHMHVPGSSSRIGAKKEDLDANAALVRSQIESARRREREAEAEFEFLGGQIQKLRSKRAQVEARSRLISTQVAETQNELEEMLTQRPASGGASTQGGAQAQGGKERELVMLKGIVAETRAKKARAEDQLRDAEAALRERERKRKRDKDELKAAKARGETIAEEIQEMEGQKEDCEDTIRKFQSNFERETKALKKIEGNFKKAEVSPRPAAGRRAGRGRGPERRAARGTPPTTPS